MSPFPSLLAAGHQAIYVGETDNAGRRAGQHQNEAQKPVPRFTVYQAAKLAMMTGGKFARFPAFLIPTQDEAAVAARILKMAPSVPSAL